MKAMTLRGPGGLDRLEMQERADPGQPGPGEMVVSCFFPNWLDGTPTVGDFAHTPGDGIDGFACEHVVVPATAMTRAPKGYDAVEAASITTAGLTAWRALDGGGPKPMIDRRFPLEQLADAFRFEMGATHFGKIGIEW